MVIPQVLTPPAAIPYAEPVATPNPPALRVATNGCIRTLAVTVILFIGCGWGISTCNERSAERAKIALAETRRQELAEEERRESLTPEQRAEEDFAKICKDYLADKSGATRADSLGPDAV
jgi:hypothetical protein